MLRFDASPPPQSTLDLSTARQLWQEASGQRGHMRAPHSPPPTLDETAVASTLRTAD
jgi:hypothetical protein